MELDITYKL